MTYLSIIEKLQIFFSMLLDFKFILVFTIILLILSLLYIIKKISGKKYILFMIVSFIVVFAISIINNYKVLVNTFDNFMTILFGNIYFPSIYCYIGVLVISFISFITSILNVMLKRIYKIINSAMFIINNILLVIVINIIAKNNIDVFSINSLYTDTSLVAILELSMSVFIVWLLSLTTIYVTNCVCERIMIRKVENSVSLSKDDNVIINPILEINVDDIKEEENCNINNTFTETIEDEELVFSCVHEIKNNNMEENSVNVILESSIENDDISNIEDNMDNNAFVLEDVKDDNTIFDTMIEEVYLDKNETLLEGNINSEKESLVTFNDILSSVIPVETYENNLNSDEYKLVNPQEIFEEKYNTIKNNYINEREEKDGFILKKDKKENLFDDMKYLNNLTDDDNMNDDVSYTLDDYKKIINMLNTLKKYSNCNNINVDDAVAISLISNYSVDDCMKFKNILESNLN